LKETDYEGIVEGDLLGDGKLLLWDERHCGWRGVDGDSNDVDGIYEKGSGGLLVDAASGRIFPSTAVAVRGSQEIPN
jgi:hypothetical protein